MAAEAEVAEVAASCGSLRVRRQVSRALAGDRENPAWPPTLAVRHPNFERNSTLRASISAKLRLPRRNGARLSEHEDTVIK